MKMFEYINTMLGKTVNISITNKDFRENYNGIVEEVGEDFIVLDPNNQTFHLNKIILRKDMIQAIREINLDNYKKKYKMKIVS